MPSQLRNNLDLNLPEVVVEDSGHRVVKFDESVEDSPVVKGLNFENFQQLLDVHLPDIADEENGLDGADVHGLQEIRIFQDSLDLLPSFAFILAGKVGRQEQLLKDSVEQAAGLFAVHLLDVVEKFSIPGPVFLLAESHQNYLLKAGDALTHILLEALILRQHLLQALRDTLFFHLHLVFVLLEPVFELH